MDDEGGSGCPCVFPEADECTEKSYGLVGSEGLHEMSLDRDCRHATWAARSTSSRSTRKKHGCTVIRALALISIAYAPKSTLYSRTCLCDSLARGTLRRDPA